MICILFCLQFSLSVVSATLWPHGLQHARPPCLSPSPGVYSNSCPLSRWYHPTISFSVVAFSSGLKSFPASGSFQISHFFASGGQSIGVSASTSVLPMNSDQWSVLSMISPSGHVEIPHVEGQRNPSKTVGAGMAVRRYPTPKGKGEAPARQ